MTGEYLGAKLVRLDFSSAARDDNGRVITWFAALSNSKGKDHSTIEMVNQVQYKPNNTIASANGVEIARGS